MKSPSKKSSISYIGGFLREARDNKGLTQREVGKKLKISPMYLSNMELNKCPVPVKYLKKMVSIYKVDKKMVITQYLKEEESWLKSALR